MSWLGSEVDDSARVSNWLRVLHILHIAVDAGLEHRLKLLSHLYNVQQQHRHQKMSPQCLGSAAHQKSPEYFSRTEHMTADRYLFFPLTTTNHNTSAPGIILLRLMGHSYCQAYPTQNLCNTFELSRYQICVSPHIFDLF